MSALMNMLSVTLVIALTAHHVFGVPVSKLSENKISKPLSSNADEKINFASEGHKLHRRSVLNVDDMVASETGYMLQNFFPYPHSNHGPFPGHYRPPFGTHYSNVGDGSYTQHHHVVNHDYHGNQPDFYHHHHHNYPHDHSKCNFDNSDESDEDRNQVTPPYPGKYTPPPVRRPKPTKVTPPTPVAPKTVPTSTITTDPTYDIDVRLGKAGQT